MLNSSSLIRILPQSELVAKFDHPQKKQVIARIHVNYSLDSDPRIEEELMKINNIRRKDGLIEYYPATRFRLIFLADKNNGKYVLHLAPMDFSYYVIQKDPTASFAAKKYVQEKVEKIARKIPKHIQSSHSILNGYNCIPLGLEILLLTKDGKTLLRRRGKHVLLNNTQWDVSFSGYCIKADRLSREQIDLSVSAKYEMTKEIGTLPANPKDIIFTGLHRNTVSDAIDILGIWKIEATADELTDYLTESRYCSKNEFETSKKAVEPFVWDCINLIINFQEIKILKELKEANINYHSLTPEALACIALGLETIGK